MNTPKPPMLFTALAVLLAAASAATAHDPGVSSTTLVVSADALTATLEVHDTDLAALAPEAAAATLAAALTVSAGGKALAASSVERRTDDHGDTVVSFRFARPDAGELEVAVPLLVVLPRGHKHLLRVRGDSGVLASRVLSAGADSLKVEVTAATGPTFATP